MAYYYTFIKSIKIKINIQINIKAEKDISC